MKFLNKPNTFTSNKQMNAYFLDRHDFAPFGIEHWLMVTAYSFVAIYLIYYCQKSANPQQYQRPLIWFLGFITLYSWPNHLSGCTMACLISKTIYLSIYATCFPYSCGWR